MPMALLNLGRVFTELDLRQDEICRAVDLACKDGFGNGEFKTLSKKKVKTPLFTMVPIDLKSRKRRRLAK